MRPSTTASASEFDDNHPPTFSPTIAQAPRPSTSTQANAVRKSVGVRQPGFKDRIIAVGASSAGIGLRRK
jgi:hypothetical protein